jgi:hypothetical protein
VFAAGTLTFAAGEVTKSFVISIINDSYVEGTETVNLKLENVTGGNLGAPNTSTLSITDDDLVAPTSNPADQADYFVRQHYLDFLSREPDLGGLNYWTGEITKCGADVACLRSRRIGVSAAFFVEQEFQQTGFYLYRLYTGSLGRQPTFAEFMGDRDQLIDGDVESRKQLFADQWVSRAAFLQSYPLSMTPAEFVNKLFDTANLQPFAAERQAQIDAMVNNGKTRAQVLRDVVEIPSFKTREFNAAFVRMQYFGYLRRNPELGGEVFWLNILNNKLPQDVTGYRAMVCAFITSAEYQLRFSSVVTHTNAECGP